MPTQAQALQRSVRVAKPTDLDAIADVHTQAFPGFVLTRLGKGFLRGYYGAVLDFPGGILYVAEADDRVVGFAAGFARPTEFSRHLRRRTLALLPHVMAGLFRNPGLLLIVVQNALGVFGGRGAAPEPHPDEAEFCSMGVHPAYQGRGLGRQLTKAFIAAARQAGVSGVYLFTDATDNDAVNAFHVSSGFTLRSTFVASGRRLRNEYYMRFQ